jgi:cytidyltransferase-like protein
MGFKSWLIKEGEGGKAVLVATGSFSPVHRGHIEMMENAKKWLEENGYEVIKGFISPKHDSYVKTKSDWIPIEDRVAMLNLMTKGSWIDIDTWEASQPTQRSRYDVVDRIQQQYPDAKAIFVCGEDVCPAYLQQLPGLTTVHGYTYWVSDREPGVSSSSAKKALKAGQSTQGVLDPEIEDYMKKFYNQ